MSLETAMRSLPPVHSLLDRPELREASLRFGRDAVVEAVRTALDEARSALVRGEPTSIDSITLSSRILAILTESTRPELRSVINATGILLNTGLGRAPLAGEAIEAVVRVASGYCNLEYDLALGDRGRRADGVEALLTRLTGAPRAAIVNNNAAATIIAVRALAQGREVIVSRGQLVEIGGSFRLPEIIEVSGAKLVEVGTTNKTRLSDYERAITPNTAALMRVHPSNYRVVGFTEDVAIGPLAELAHARGLFAIDDIGSGVLQPGWTDSVRDEPTALEGIKAGADLVLFSGDKLLGGPQAGILVGSAEAIDKVTRDPLMRALRVDKMTLAALEATLRLHLDSISGRSRIPVWTLADVPTPRLLERAEAMARTFRDDFGLNAKAEPSTAYFGGGTTPTEAIASAAVRVEAPVGPRRISEGDWARTLRVGDPSVVPRVQGGSVWFDLRSVPVADYANLFMGVRESLGL